MNKVNCAVRKYAKKLIVEFMIEIFPRKCYNHI